MAYVNLFNENALTKRQTAVGASAQSAPQALSKPADAVWNPTTGQWVSMQPEGVQQKTVTQPVSNVSQVSAPLQVASAPPLQAAGKTASSAQPAEPLDYSTIPAPSFNNLTGERPTGTYLNTMTGQYEPVRASGRAGSGGSLGTDFTKIVYGTQPSYQQSNRTIQPVPTPVGKPTGTYWNERTGQWTPIQPDGSTPGGMPRTYDDTGNEKKPVGTYWNERTGQWTPIQPDGSTPGGMPRVYDDTVRTARFESLSRIAQL